jgi:hypothetical protein
MLYPGSAALPGPGTIRQQFVSNRRKWAWFARRAMVRIKASHHSLTAHWNGAFELAQSAYFVASRQFDALVFKCIVLCEAGVVYMHID